MGWQSYDAPGHEGHLVALVAGDPDDPDSWRELHGRPEVSALARVPRDTPDEVDVAVFQAACSCGWRSPRFRAPPGTSWWPSYVELPKLHEDLRDLARDLWSQHWRLPDALAARAQVRVPRDAPPVLPASGSGRGGHLSLVDEPGGLRHYLLGQPVHAGACLELMLSDGRWVPGRYENARGDDYLQALFYFDVSCVSAAPDWAGAVPNTPTLLEARVELTGGAMLRWPRR